MTLPTKSSAIPVKVCSTLGGSYSPIGNLKSCSVKRGYEEYDLTAEDSAAKVVMATAKNFELALGLDYLASDAGQAALIAAEGGDIFVKVFDLSPTTGHVCQCCVFPGDMSLPPGQVATHAYSLKCSDPAGWAAF